MADCITYVGLDVHKEAILVAGGEKRPARRGSGARPNRETPAALDYWLRKLGGDGLAMRFCYEAGPRGYDI
jgi:hypothetical protein